MYKIYWRAGSASFAIEALLEELGTPYERVMIENSRGPQTPDWYRALNPLGQVPLLALPDGRIMSESAAIMIWLADTHAEAGLAPLPDEPDRAPYLRWMVFLATNVYITMRRIYRGDLYTDNEAHRASIREKGEHDLTRDFEVIEAALTSGPYLLGKRFSAADIYLAMFPDWYVAREELLSGLPRIAQLCEAVLARPALKRARAFHMGG